MIIGFQYSSVQKTVTVQYVVVAGGGGGGISSGGSPGGGGGAGGYRSSVIGEGSGREAYNSNLSAEPTLNILKGALVPVSVGAGGPNSTIGSDSYFSSITSIGGGKGGGSPQVGGNGGSGGGAGSNTGAAGGTGTTGQGWNGNQAGNPYGGGGGGAGSGGGNGPFPEYSGVSSYTKGGYGRTTFITGSARPLAGGGCGGAPDGFLSNNVYDTVNPGGGYTPPSGTSVFYGGGTNGYISAIPQAGTVNTGGGGGGGSSARNENGAAGGRGIIFLKYPDIYTITIGPGLIGTTPAAVGGFKTTEITNGAGNVSWT